MSKEFNLSDKVFRINKLMNLFPEGDICWNSDDELIHKDNVKRFVMRIKATMLLTPSPTKRGEFIKWLAREIDKLAGDKFK